MRPPARTCSWKVNIEGISVLCHELGNSPPLAEQERIGNDEHGVGTKSAQRLQRPIDRVRGGQLQYFKFHAENISASTGILQREFCVWISRIVEDPDPREIRAKLFEQLQPLSFHVGGL